MGKRAALTGERIVVTERDTFLAGYTGMVLYYIPKRRKPYVVILDTFPQDWPNPYATMPAMCLRTIGDVSEGQFLRYIVDYTMYFDDVESNLRLGIYPYTYGMDLAYDY